MTLATPATNKATALQPSTPFSTSETTRPRSAYGRPTTSSTARTSAPGATDYSL